MNYIIRQEQKKDYEETEQVIKAAFAHEKQSDQDEHHLVSRIRKSEFFVPELSLIAVAKNTEKILGHVLLSKILIDNPNNGKIESLALAPVSVLPADQNQGIGKAMIQKALKKATELGFYSVVVLGHPEYYPKFGFHQASLWQIKAPFDVPEEALMIKELKEGALNKVSGVIEYPSIFFG